MIAQINQTDRFKDDNQKMVRQINNHGFYLNLTRLKMHDVCLQNHNCQNATKIIQMDK